MNAPARHESYVLEDGEKPYVSFLAYVAESRLNQSFSGPRQCRSNRRHQDPERRDNKDCQARSHPWKHAPGVRTRSCFDSHTPFDASYSQLLAMPQILFAGYKVPHPLHPYFIIKIQTDGTITPQEILEQACTKLIGTMSSLETKFKREFSYKDVEGPAGGVTAAAGEDPYGTAGGAGTGAWGRGRDYLDF